MYYFAQWVCDVSITDNWSQGTGPTTGLGTCTDRSHVRMKWGMPISSTPAEKTIAKFYKQL